MYELTVFMSSMFIGFFISIIWSYYVLRPYYVYPSSKMDEPFYDGSSMITSSETFRGRYYLLNGLLILAPFVLVASVIPDMLFHNVFYYMISIIFCSIILLGFIIDLRGEIFFHPRFVKHGELAVLEHFSPDGYSYTYYYVLGIIIVALFIIFGVFYYLYRPNMNSILMIIICSISMVLTIFPDWTNQFIPLNLRTRNGYIIYALSIITILFIISLMYS